MDRYTELFDHFAAQRYNVWLRELSPDANLTAAQQQAASLLYDWHTATLGLFDLMRRGCRPF